MKKNVIQSNDNNVFYKKSRGLLEVALWMQDQDGGVSINDIMSMLKVSKRTAIRIKDSIINWLPEIYAVNVQHNKKKRIMPKGTITVNKIVKYVAANNNIYSFEAKIFFLQIPIGELFRIIYLKTHKNLI